MSAIPRRRLGDSELYVSPIGLGTFNTVRSPEALGAVVNRAIDAGINLIDTAESYANGQVERALGSILGSHRKNLVLATKWGGGARARQPGVKAGSEAYIVPALEASLRRLKTDYIDLYQYHHVDVETPIADTVEVLDQLVRQGKIRTWGVSNMSAKQAMDALRACRKARCTEFVTCQSHYSLLTRKPEHRLLPALRKQGLHLLAYFPLERGLLTGKYKRNSPLPEGSRLARAGASASVERLLSDQNFARIERLEAFAARQGRTLVELALAWLLAEPCVASAIVGATSPQQVEQNVAAAEWELTTAEKEQATLISDTGTRLAAET